MNVIADLFNSILQIILVVTLVMLIVFRKKFNMPETSLSRTAKFMLALVATAAMGLCLYKIGHAYYLALNPDFEYEKVASEVGYHIYTPSFIPGGRVQDTTFHLWDQDLAGQTNAVRVAYSVPLAMKDAAAPVSSVILIQAKMAADFDLPQYANSFREQDKGQTIQVKEIKLTVAQMQSAFEIVRPFGNSQLVELITLMSDNVLVRISAIGETVDNLKQMAESLE